MAKFKVVFFGSENTGKTSLFNSISNGINNASEDNQWKTTTTLQSCIKTVEGSTLEIWDTPSQLRFEDLTTQCLTDANVVIVTVDLSSVNDSRKC